MAVDYQERHADLGLVVVRQAFSDNLSSLLARCARQVVKAAPLMRPTMADGTPLRVQVTSCGDVGWMATRARGYHYADHHPRTGRWPAMDEVMRACLAEALARAYGDDMAWIAGIYDTCLLNFYGRGDSLGWHQDVTEEDRCMPIVGISLGDPARFEVELGEEQVSTIVRSGDVVVMGGYSRLARHRVAEVMPPDLFGPRSPLSRPGRLSLTYRRARCLPGDIEDRIRRKR